MRKTIISTAYNLYFSITNPKLWVAAIIVLAQIFRVIVPYAKIANDYNASVNAAVITIFFSDKFSVIVIFIALLFFFSELSFSDPQQIYHITRSGKRSWYLSQLFYIIAISITVTVIIILFSWALICADLSFDNSWGRVINTIPKSADLRDNYAISGMVTEDVIASFTPHTAALWSVFVGTFLFIVFGTLIFSLNMLTRKIGGFIAGAVIITLRLFSNLLNTQFKYFCPLEWCNIRVVDIFHSSGLPDPEYIVFALSALYIFSVIVVIFRSRKNIDIL